MSTKRKPSRSAVAARERARAARMRLDADRALRDEQIETAAANYFAADEERAALLDQITVHERAMADAIGVLEGLGEPVGRICELLDVDAREVRRLRALTSSARTEPTSSPSAPEREHAEPAGDHQPAADDVETIDGAETMPDIDVDEEASRIFQQEAAVPVL